MRRTNYCTTLLVAFLTLSSPPFSLVSTANQQKQRLSPIKQTSPPKDTSVAKPSVKTTNDLSPKRSPELFNFHLRAGQIYEELEQWEEAERQYLAAGKDSSPVIRQRALEGIRRVRHANKSVSTGFIDWFDQGVAFLLRLIGVLLAAYLLPVIGLAIVRSSQRIEVDSFDTHGDEEFSGRISITFARLRARMSQVFPRHQEIRGRHLPRLGFPVLVPVLRQDLPELSFEAGGFRIASVASLFSSLFRRPRFRIVGGAQTSSNLTNIHAEIWQRRWLLDYKLQGVASRQLPHGAGKKAIVELETFVYDVFLRIIYATP